MSRLVLPAIVTMLMATGLVRDTGGDLVVLEIEPDSCSALYLSSALAIAPMEADALSSLVLGSDLK